MEPGVRVKRDGAGPAALLASAIGEDPDTPIVTRRLERGGLHPLAGAEEQLGVGVAAELEDVQPQGRRDGDG